MLNIFLSDLGAYNNGTLTGDWYDMEDPNSRQEALDYASALSAAGKEYFISDYESDWTEVNEYTPVQEIADDMSVLDALGTQEEAVFKALKAEGRYEVDDLLQIVQDGEYMEIEKDKNAFFTEPGTELAHYYVDEGLVDLGDGIAERYFNYEAFGRDLMFDVAIYAETNDSYIYVMHNVIAELINKHIKY